MARKVNNKAQAITRNKAKQALDFTIEAVMDLMVRQYSVAKDTKKTEYVLTDKADKKARITIRGSKDSWMLISNKEHAGWTYHERKSGSWYGKAVKAADAVQFIKDMTGKELQLG